MMLNTCKIKDLIEKYPKFYNKVRYSGNAPMYVNVVFIAMETLNPHMTSLIHN